MSTSTNHFDAIVVGGGHAGTEAVRVLSAGGMTVALITLDDSKIGAMSCNPAIGGVAKSHLVFEIDALGGIMGQAADFSGIQAKRLNLAKGPAVRSTRIQCDKQIYQSYVERLVKTLPGVSVLKGEAVEVISERANGKSIVRGIVMRTGESIFARTVLITSGTFMGGILFCGDSRAEGGRIGEAPSVGLSKSLEHLGHSLRRLKTGTPARLNAKSINFSRWSKQWGDSERRLFSWKSAVHKLPQVCCYIGYTNEKTHDVIRKNFHKSPLFSGDIVGTGPRYCPSVEDKVRRFKDKTRHQIFLEPEGLCTNFIYPNGLSTSLPEDVQLEFLRTLDGLEAVEILRPGYAVEYDVIDPRSLSHGFESKTCDGLFVAGQVNRTSGYEEAASQGLWAGMNALLYLRNEEQLIPQRSRSYIETLVDDLVTKGTDEPYRMFTSRSEFRLLLREDNANDRLHDLGCRLGILSDEQRAWYEALNKELVIALSDFKSRRIRLDENRVVSYFEYLKRPEITWENLDSGDQFSDLVIEKIEIDSKYSGYLIKQEAELREYNKLIGMRLKPDLDIRSVYGLSEEVIEKYEILKPKSVFELSQISGMTPSAVLAIARVGAVSRETIA